MLNRGGMKKRKKRSGSDSSSSSSEEKDDDYDTDSDFNPSLSPKADESPQPKTIQCRATSSGSVQNPSKQQQQRKRKLALPKAHRDQKSSPKNKRVLNEVKVHAGREFGVFDSEDEACSAQPRRNLQRSLQTESRTRFPETDEEIGKERAQAKESNTKLQQEDKEEEEKEDVICSERPEIEENKSRGNLSEAAKQHEEKLALPSNKKIKEADSTKALQAKVPTKIRSMARRAKNLPSMISGGSRQSTDITSGAKSKSSFSSSSSTQKLLPLPSTPRRRVIGLSRRVRPTPLHPYLSKPDI